MPKLYRGVLKENFIINHNYVTLEVFPFSKKDVDESGYIRESVNWSDDDGSLSEILNRKNPSVSYVFEGGACELDVDEISTKLKPYIIEKSFRLDHELDPASPDNHYHGNVGIGASVGDGDKKNIKMQLVAIVGYNVHSR